MHRPKLDLHPPRSLNPLQWMWVLWALLATSLLVISAWAFATRFSVQPARSVRGSFESQTPFVDVVLPADVTLSELLIINGDPVVVGQKLARLDQVALHELLDRLRQDLAENAAASTCWRDPSLPPTSSGETLSTSLQSCYNAKRRQQLAREQLMHRRHSLQRETALAVRELVLRAKNTPPAEQKILMLRAALERETLNSVVRDVEFELADLIQSQDASRLHELTALEADSAALHTRLLTLEEIAADPWLYAPQDGRIERLRRLPETAARAWDVTLAQIQTDAPNTYQARFVIPVSEADTLHVGDPLFVTLAGIPVPQNRFPARVQTIKSMDTSASNASEVLVRLSTPDQQTLGILRTLPAGTRSSMQVDLPVQKLSSMLSAATDRMKRSF
ncbi:HlyD family efflux transporter periplasmic adaptor subunit [Shimia sagamensis]|uniref:HlyD family secretion protein n=1 Tax=Shimia sagamensis TaxID=1566352 RepID=A0ABY1P8I8_9RHOB|nr:HlyD family efflux transporter periplasmic adaptor subunit [Shimia sagamensis]SMP28495.1 HlyD family secretion protein [Shimia sagamensis]